MKTTPRLFAEQRLEASAETELSPEQTHYIAHVMRLKPGDPLRLFNGLDGEWLAYVATLAKRRATAVCERRLAEAVAPPDIDFIFALLKHARLDYMVQKAVELGARRLRPVITQRTVGARVNLARMRANAIEAAEQCNLVHVPEVTEPRKLNALLGEWEENRALIHCDETAATGDPLAALRKLTTPAAVLIGPEGGFAGEERQLLSALPNVTAISLGPRTLRADTAAMAALTLVQAVLGDWRRET